MSGRGAQLLPDFATQIAEAQRQLAESIVRAGLTRDAYRHVMEAQVVALSVLPAFVAEIDARHQPWTKDERREAALDFVARLDKRIAQRMVQFNRWAMVVIAVAVPVFCVGSFLGGWWWGRHNGTLEVQYGADGLAAAAISRGGTEASEQWLTLMRNNDITRSPRSCFMQEGRAACTIALWTETPPPPAATTRQSQSNATGPGQATERAGRLPDRAARQ